MLHQFRGALWNSCLKIIGTFRGIMFTVGSRFNKVTLSSITYRVTLLKLVSSKGIFFESFRFFRAAILQSTCEREVFKREVPVDTRRCFNLYKTSIRHQRPCTDNLLMLKRRRVSTGVWFYRLSQPATCRDQKKQSLRKFSV